MASETRPPGKVGPARRRGLADEVADTVRAAIFDGTYPPGTQLRETELSAELEVSRGPVREALMRLEGEGLLRSGWHRGAVVVELSADDVAEIDSLRGALEHLAVQLAVEHASDEDLDTVARAADRMARAGDAHELAALDVAFHDAVYAATGHRRLQEAWNTIRSQVHLFLVSRIGVSVDGYLTTVPGEHRELAEALRARDTESALRLFADHREHALDVLTGRAD
ncbi:GntR family transcriptional regulator [Nocardiopsis sp. HNM0947]|uniref:GntR family transcriptional regulator n=1 Tax=Nocardiopsis coralli TaxID=2772213 RepID=A0ABR9P3J6_9ACTN|nr:GntR family transcriptional regulator [Nocardiopsis coralli]MBE2998310.1 GntR family transcriptional regulator [Nocardiopsis coralli]